jgi:hypothetical protein
MKYTKFVVKVSHIDAPCAIGAPCAEQVQRIVRKPIQTTLERNLALLMGMEVLESFKKSRWTPEMVTIQVNG